jgi:hypothetical protein
VRRQGRLGAHRTALAFEAVEQRRLLAANVSARADPDLDVEIMCRAGNAGAQHALVARNLQRPAKNLDRVGVFRADVDEAPCRSNGNTGDRHAFDQAERVAFHGQANGGRLDHLRWHRGASPDVG